MGINNFLISFQFTFLIAEVNVTRLLAHVVRIKKIWIRKSVNSFSNQYISKTKEMVLGVPCTISSLWLMLVRFVSLLCGTDCRC